MKAVNEILIIILSKYWSSACNIREVEREETAILEIFNVSINNKGEER